MLAAGVEVRPLERTPSAKMKLDLNDGLSGTPIPLRTAYVAGHEVEYWDLGTAPTTAEPMWVFKNRDPAAAFVHPPLVDSIPGDTAYSPIRIIFEVYFTPNYRGEQFPSLRALDDGVELKLLEEPVQTETFTNCVVTVKETQLEAGGGGLHNSTLAFYRDRSVNQFCVNDYSGGNGIFPTKMGAPVFGNGLLLRRENQPIALDESLFKSDLNADGDMLDANTVFESDVGDAAYTSLWKNLDVVVNSTYMFGAFQSFDAMFDKKSWGLAAKSPDIVEYKDTTTVVNRPLKAVPR